MNLSRAYELGSSIPDLRDLPDDEEDEMRAQAENARLAREEARIDEARAKREGIYD